MSFNTVQASAPVGSGPLFAQQTETSSGAIVTYCGLTYQSMTGVFVQITPANPLPVSGSVTATISGNPTVTVGGGTVALSGTSNVAVVGAVAVTGTFWQATQPVSLATNVTVVGTGTFAVQAAQSGTWNVGTVTTVSAVTSITSALPAGTNLLGYAGQAAQKTASTAFQSSATSNGNGTVVTTDGYDGQLLIIVSNGAGTATLTIQGSYDNFATAQDVMTVGLYLLATGATVNTGRAIISGAVAVAANTSYAYACAELYPYMRAVVSSASGLGAGSSVTGLTAKVYQVPG